MGRRSGWTVRTAGRPAARAKNRQKDVRTYRGQIPSPGAPTIAWREDRVRFWAAIARGLKSDDAGVEAGVSSPVAYRWFRNAGGVNPCLPPTVTGRYLSFTEREDIAIWHAQNVGVREIARRLHRHPSTISRELRRNASSRSPTLRPPTTPSRPSNYASARWSLLAFPRRRRCPRIRIRSRVPSVPPVTSSQNPLRYNR